MKLSEELAWRGLIKDKTFQDVSWLDEPKTFYHGVDATADSLTVGNLAVLMLARRLIERGWKAVILIGGATSLIGDPGGKIAERELISRDEIKRNSNAIRNQINQLFDGQDFTLVDNYDWWSKSATNEGMLYLDFLREYGKKFSMTELMQREFVTERMGGGASGISYAEFSYGLVQAYDYYRLSLKRGDKDGQDAVLQVGGSDQWSNMLLGVALIRKIDNKEGHNKEAHALSMPLIVDKATGQKFGKTEAGAIWLDPQKTTSTQFYQFWVNTDDADVEDYLKIFTLLPKDKIEHYVMKHKSAPEHRYAQQQLAYEVTRTVHGEEALDRAERVTDLIRGRDSNLLDIKEEDVSDIRNEIAYTKAKIGDSIQEKIVEVKLAASKTEANRLMASNAISINGIKVPPRVQSFKKSDFINGRLLIRRGKAYKDSALIELE